VAALCDVLLSLPSCPSQSFETKIELFGVDAKEWPRLEETWHHPYGEAW
jgi:hypothetical protein